MSLTLNPSVASWQAGEIIVPLDTLACEVATTGSAIFANTGIGALRGTPAGFWWTSGSYQAAWSTSTATTHLSDGLVGDVGTYEEVDTTGLNAAATFFVSLGTAQKLSVYDLTCGTSLDEGLSWVLEGSNDHSSWTSLASGSGGLSAFERYTGTVASAGPWLYLRLSVRATDDGIVGSKWLRVSDLRFPCSAFPEGAYPDNGYGASHSFSPGSVDGTGVYGVSNFPAMTLPPFCVAAIVVPIGITPNDSVMRLDGLRVNRDTVFSQAQLTAACGGDPSLDYRIWYRFNNAFTNSGVTGSFDITTTLTLKSMSTPLNPTVLQRPVLGLESSLGSGGTPNTQLLSLTSFDFKPNPDMFEHHAAGMKAADRVDLNREWGTWTGKAEAPTYGDIGYMLKLLFGQEIVNTVTGGVYDHIFTLNPFDIDPVASFNGEVGSSAVSRGGLGSFATDFKLSTNREKSIECDINGMCQAVDFGRTRTVQASCVQTVTITGATTGSFKISYKGETATVAYNASNSAVQSALRALGTIGTNNVNVTLSGTTYTITGANQLLGVPMEAFTVNAGTTDGTVATVLVTQGGPTTFSQNSILPGSFQAYFADTFGDLEGASGSNTLSSKHFDTNFNFNRKPKEMWYQNSASLSYGDVVEELPDLSVEFTMPYSDPIVADLVTKMRAGTDKFVRLASIGAQITGGYYYGLTIDAAIRPKVEDLPGTQGVVGAKFSCPMKYDAASGFWFRVTLRNDVATYS